MNIFKTIIATMIVALLFSSVAKAEPTLRLGIGTYHIPFNGYESSDWNNNNSLIGIAVDNIEFGTMINSYYTRSYYLAYRTPNLPLALGVVSGYSFDCINDNAKHECNTTDLIPLISLYYEVTDIFSFIVVGNAISAVISIK
jgi:hypothetical protein